MLALGFCLACGLTLLRGIGCQTQEESSSFELGMIGWHPACQSSQGRGERFEVASATLFQFQFNLGTVLGFVSCKRGDAIGGDLQS